MKVYLEQHESEEKCLAKIKKQYGDHFTVIRKKNTHRPVFFGLGSRPCVEITFTLDHFSDTVPVFNTYEKNVSTIQPETRVTLPKKRLQKKDEEEEKIKILQNVAERSSELATTLNPIIENTIKRRESVASSSSADLAVQHLAAVVEQLNQKIEHMSKHETVPVEREHASIAAIDRILEENEFSPDYREKLRARMRRELSVEELQNKEELNAILQRWIGESVAIRKKEPQGKPRIIVLVGPTGVGKTTTLAKLAAYYSVILPKQSGREQHVRVITTDNYRIGASEQIRKYCYHMKIPFSLVENPADLRVSLDLHKEDADVICIDTSGRSQYDQEKLLAMTPFLDLLPEDAEIYLTISAGTKAADIRDIMERYKVCKYKELIITKFDETRYAGNLLSVLAETDVPVAYITTGQSVPRDFEVATVERFLGKTQGLGFSES